jgi:hypothetical protein
MENTNHGDTESAEEHGEGKRQKFLNNREQREQKNARTKSINGNEGNKERIEAEM